MRLLDLIESEFESRNFNSLQKQLSLLKNHDLIKFRSKIVSEIIRIHIFVMKKYFNFSKSKNVLPKYYMKLLTNQLFELNDNEVRVPLQYIKDASQFHCKELDAESDEAYELTKEFYKEDNNRSKICSLIAGFAYSEMEEIVTVIDESFNGGVKNHVSGNEMLLYPIIELDSDCKEELESLLANFYDLYNNHHLQESDRVLDEIYSEKYNKDESMYYPGDEYRYPGAIEVRDNLDERYSEMVDNNEGMYCLGDESQHQDEMEVIYDSSYPFIEVLINLVANIITKYASFMPKSQLIYYRDSKTQVNEILTWYWGLDDDINALLTQIEKIVFSVKQIILECENERNVQSILHLAAEKTEREREIKLKEEKKNSKKDYITEYADMKNLKPDEIDIVVSYKQSKFDDDIDKVVEKIIITVRGIKVYRPGLLDLYSTKGRITKPNVNHEFLMCLLEPLKFKQFEYDNKGSEAKLTSRTRQFNDMMKRKFPITERAVKKPHHNKPIEKFKLKKIYNSLVEQDETDSGVFEIFNNYDEIVRS